MGMDDGEQKCAMTLSQLNEALGIAEARGMKKAIWKFDTLVAAYDDRGYELAAARSTIERVRALLDAKLPPDNSKWRAAIKKALEP
jgi:hypothetical protein